MASGGGILPTENYYKVQLDTNNLLIQGPGVDFNQQVLEKIDWNSFQQNTGMDISWVDEYFSIDKPPVGYLNFHSKLATQAAEQGIDYRTMYKGLRQAGYEGVVYYQGSQAFQMEIILLDPNDTLNVGTKVNIVDSNIEEFLQNDRQVNQLDELVIKPPTDTPSGSLGAAKLNDPLVFDSWVDNYANTTTSFVDNLPLVKPVKDMFLNAADNRLTRLARQVATPGGILDAVDIWEIGVLALVAGAIAYNEIDEIPKIVKNTILRSYNLSQGRPIDAPLRIIGLPVLSVSEYDIDFEYAMETLEKGEKVMPTEIAIDYVQEKAEEFEGEGTASGYAYMTSSAKNTDTMETTQKIQPGVQEEKMFEQAKSKKNKATGSAGAKIL